MNKKLIGAVIGALALGTATIARADEAPAAKPAKEAKKATKGDKGDKGDKDAKKGGEKSCGADGKSCGGKK